MYALQYIPVVNNLKGVTISEPSKLSGFFKMIMIILISLQCDCCEMVTIMCLERLPPVRAYKLQGPECAKANIKLLTHSLVIANDI